jgi:hypothetical protein
VLVITAGPAAVVVCRKPLGNSGVPGTIPTIKSMQPWHGPAAVQEELHFVLERRWHNLGQTLDPEDFTNAQAIAAVARIT